MVKMRSVAPYLLALAATSAWIAACSSNPSPPAGTSGTSGTSGGTSGSSGSTTGASGTSGTTGSTTPMDGGASDAADASKLGLLVDNMTTTGTGTRISLQVPAGESPGSYYTYSDNASNNLGGMTLVISTAQLLDAPVTPAVANADGSQIVGELCFNGRVVNYAGLGMSLAYGNPPDASPESGISSPVPFDASAYSGVSFYVLVTPSDGGTLPSLHYSVPDTQTADKAAYPAALCNVDGGTCDDDFGSDVPFVAGTWTKVSFKWAELTQQGFGTAFPTGIKDNQLIGMKWQANGDGADAAADSFNFCISDIYFTP